VAGGAGAGAEALSRRGGTQGAAAGLHLPSMLIASRGPGTVMPTVMKY